MSGTIVFQHDTDWSASSGLFNWVVEYLANRVDDEQTQGQLWEISDHDFRWLNLDNLTPQGRAQVLSILRNEILAQAEENLPETSIRGEAVNVIRELADLAKDGPTRI
jgi:hypothetical protein